MKNSIKVKLLGLGLVGCMSLGLMGCSANSLENEIDEKVTETIQSNVEEKEYMKEEYETSKYKVNEKIYYRELCAIEDIKVDVEEGENVYTININLIRNNDTNEEFTIETLDKNLENIKSFEDFKVIDHREYEGGELVYRSIAHGYEYLLDGESVEYVREMGENEKLYIIGESSVSCGLEIALGFWID